MNILFVLSQLELTGAETYAASLIEKLTDKGHKVAIVSDTLTNQIKVPYYSLDINNRKSLINRFKHIRFLGQIIKQENINLLHAHSRASSWVAYFASRINRIPLITTAHCIYPVHLSRKIMPCFGEKVIAVCGAVKDHLTRDLKIKSEDIFLIPNGIDVYHFSPQVDSAGVREGLGIQPGANVVSWIGRFSGPRGKLIEKMVKKVFPEVLAVIPDLKLLIVSGGQRPVSLEGKVEAINQQFGREVIRFTGLRKDIPGICAISDLIIGAGRVALEAMACGRPVIAVGENKFVGLINPQSLKEGIYTNFGDCCEQQPVDCARLAQSVIDVLKDKKESALLGQWGRQVAIEQFDLEKVVAEVEEVYEKALVK
ncbi:MAG: glycosyltransferase [bacterium]|nr:glycosyltransferase [bacterium]